MERELICCALSSRNDYDLITEHIKVKKKDKTYSAEFDVVIHRIGEYYSRDGAAQSVDVNVLGMQIEETVRSEKLVSRLKEYLSEAVAASVSVPNVREVVVLAKEQEVADKLAQELLSGFTPKAKELYAELQELRSTLSLDEDEEDDVLNCVDLAELMESEYDPTNVIEIYPKSLNDRLDAGARKGHHIVIFGQTNLGKCLALGTQVLMADGSSRSVEDVKNGEYVAGPSGPRLVSGTTRGSSKMYKITYSWGESYTVNDEHILSLKCTFNEKSSSSGEVINVPVKEYITWSNYKKRKYKGWKSGIEFEEQHLPMDPYLLGIWLGDGSTGRSSVTTVDQEVLAALVAEYGYPTKVEQGITYTFGFSGMCEDLQHAGVWERKHIPNLYLRSSREQRLELLAGLIDSDGYNCKGRGFTIVTNKDELKDGYLYLARSLGFHSTAKRIFKRATNSNHEGSWYWSVYIGSEAHPVVPVRLDRKKSKVTYNPKRKGLHFGIKVEDVGDGEYAGFCVDGDHLFMLADFTVTHNTGFNVNLGSGVAYQGKRVLHLINEDRERDVYVRYVSNLSGMTKHEIRDNPSLANEKARPRGLDNVFVKAIRPGTPDQIKHYIEKYEPEVVIVDQLRNLQMKAENRTNQLESAATSMRNLAKQCNVLMVSVTQAGDSASNKLVLTAGDVDSSNVGIPAQADLLIGIGADEAAKAEGLRWLSIIKNKISGIEDQLPVKINTILSRYTNV